MRENKPSMTAWRSAVRRAAHQVWDDPIVFRDPLALKIVGPKEEAALRKADPRAQSQVARTIRAFMVARSRFTEDALAEARARGVRQYVVMGAGLDTSPCREAAQGMRVFEIDHPATQVWKRARLAETGIAVPDSVTFVPVDFARQTLGDTLPPAGWDARQPTFFSWLGVTAYLKPEAVMGTLGFVAGCPRGSEIVFDVSTPSSHVTPLERLERFAVALKIALSGEPNGTRFDPSVLAAELRTRGFSRVESFTGGQINARYFEGRADKLMVSNRSALIQAST
jgi:methyltransferase (TIGR00027 family)